MNERTHTTLPSRPVFVVDFDGTLVEDDHWPAMGDWLPGAVDAMKELLKHGRVKVFSSRLNPYQYGFDGEKERPAKDVKRDMGAIRDMLDGADLSEVEIHATPGKPSGDFYIDNLAVEFRGDWDEVLRRVLDPVGRHPQSARFHEIIRELAELHDRKQSDYGRGNDPFANVRASTEWNVPGWVGAMVRANDKVRRLQTQAIRGSLTNESAIDAFKDLAVYAIIACVLFEQGE